MPDPKYANTSHGHPDYEGAVVFHAKGTGGPITYAISVEEAGKTGLRETTNPNTGERIMQFGLCRDAYGEWVYPPFKKRTESAADVLQRNAETRQRMQRCPKPGGDHV